MKKIEAFVKPFKVDSVQSALRSVGVDEIQVLDIQHLSKDKFQEFYRGTEYAVDLEPKTLLVVFVEDDREAEVVEAIRRTATTENGAAGIIAITPVESVLAIP